LTQADRLRHDPDVIIDHVILATNQTTNSVGLKTSNKGHNDAGRALEVAGNAVLGVVEVEPRPVVDAPVIAAAPEPAGANQPAAAPTLSERLRELADLHKDGILSDEEFASAKAKLLGGL
jgi:putative oligomerization/nucleic acid binding protein